MLHIPLMQALYLSLILNNEQENMGNPDLQKVWSSWTWIEFVVILIGLLSTVTACLANYGWHWIKERMFFMIFSAVPYVLLLLGNYIAHRLVKSRFIQPVTTLLAITITSLSLIVYVKAVIYPNHSSGMIFAILPISLMMAIPVVLIIIVVGFFIMERRRP